jgi:hypothetical protein
VSELLAHVVALVHGAAVVLLVVGGLVSLRHARVLWLHLPVALVIGGLHLAGADCPLTGLERSLREDPYDGGFLQHYALGPLGVDARSTGGRLLQYAVVGVPNLVALSLWSARPWSRRSAERQQDLRAS